MAHRLVILRRTVRFAVNDPRAASPQSAPGTPAAPANGYAGLPALRGLGRHYELDVACLGRVDPITGYFVNIKEIDTAVRAHAVGLIERACHERPWASPESVLRDLMAPLNRGLGGVLHSVRWRLTPTYSVEMHANDTRHALIRQCFEFAASHRLHAAGLTDEENRRCFGKCNHAAGHGHNYIVEPAVAVAVGGAGSLDLPGVEAIVLREVVDRFDHKHLNADLPEFGPAGLNPSVENIAKVCYDRLSAPIAAAGGRLASVTVWETEKTSCTFPADLAPPS